MADEQQRQQIRRTSDRLLDAVDDLKAAERRKRSKPMSTPAFHRLAEEVRVKADEVWRTAAEEEAGGERLTGPQRESIEDERPRR
jgi:hypothetical protein